MAAPQCISGRTSYLHVRLEFLPYPQVIPLFCNTSEFEPRRSFTSASLCPWIAHVVSGRIGATYAHFRLGCPLAPQLYGWLTCNADALAGSFYKRHAISPWWLLPQWPLTAGKYEVSGSLSSPFRGAFHLSLTVLVHYRSHWVVSLGGWSPLLPTRFRVSRGTQDARPDSCSRRYRTLTVSGRAFQHVRVSSDSLVACPTTPFCPKTARFGLIPVRSPLLRDSRLISLRRATEMFQFAHCPLVWLCVHQRVSRHHSGWVAPFGISGLIAWMQLPLNVSPVSASFFGPMHLGIHLVLCVACSLLFDV